VQCGREQEAGKQSQSRKNTSNVQTDTPEDGLPDMWTKDTVIVSVIGFFANEFFGPVERNIADVAFDRYKKRRAGDPARLSATAM